MKLAVAIALVAVLVVPASALSATPITIGQGVQPAVTVDGAGTAYIAWIGDEPSVTSLHFCRLPRGGPNCAVNLTLPVPGTSLSRPYVVLDGSTVRIITYRYGLTGARFAAVYMLTSTDGGNTFDGGTQIGVVAFHDAIRGPGGQVSLIEDVGTAKFQRVPIDGSGPVTTFAELAPDHPYNPSIAVTGPNALVATFANGSGAAQFRRWTGSGDPNDVSTWTPAQDFAPYASYMRFATGSSGVFLLSDNAQGNQEVRRFAADGSGFAAPVQLPGPAHELTGDSKDMTEDPGGRLHVVWPFGDAAGHHIGYATSDDGTSWQATKFDGGDPNDVNQAAGAMRVSIADDHVGVAVWQTGGGTREIRAISVGPSAGATKPTLGKTAAAAPVKGTVRVKLPAGTTARRAKSLGLKGAATGFVKLTSATLVPVGSTFDTTRGTVKLATARGGTKPDQSGRFNGSQFVFQQGRSNPLTTLSMAGGGLKGCSTRVPSGGAPRVVAARRSRSLFGNAKGRFRTRGRNSSATVRGTKWLTKDTCAGTLTVVRQGTVVVRDFTKRRTVVIKKGHRYFARATKKR